MSSPASLPSLQSALVDLIDLSLAGKQLHWNIHGPHFRSVHLQLDVVIDEVRIAADDVAERAAAIGGEPDGRASAVAETSKVGDVGGGKVADDKVIAMFAEKLDQTARRIEATLPDLDDDMPTQDMLIGIVTQLDKQAWMFRAMQE